MVFINKKDLKTNECLEIQVCNEPDMAKALSTKNIFFGKDDSVYVEFDNFNIFYKKYLPLFGEVMHHSGHKGPIDMYGLNYLTKEDCSTILDILKKNERGDCNLTKVVQIVETAIENNGLYIFGI